MRLYQAIGLGIVLGVIGVFYAAYGPGSTSEPIDAVRVATNQQKLEKCRDMRICVGGFVKFDFDEHFYRLDSNCTYRRCDGYITGLNALLQPVFAETLNRINHIVLPDEPAWDITNRAYGKQFVMSH